MKRLLDIVFSSAGLIILAPLFAVIAVLIKRESPGPVIFSQRRIGKDFKAFTIYKFRTMVVDAPLQGLPITASGDNRITGIGMWLRRTKIDELPELFNVLVGDMSLVGPRPEVPKYVEMFRDEYQDVLRVRPGITDYAAIEFSNEEEILKKYALPEDGYIRELLPAKLNLYRKYCDHHNFFTDLTLIFMTVRKLTRGISRKGTQNNNL